MYVVVQTVGIIAYFSLFKPSLCFFQITTNVIISRYFLLENWVKKYLLFLSETLGTLIKSGFFLSSTFWQATS